MGDLTGVDITEIILLIGVVGVGLGGFIWAAMKDD